MIRNRSRNTAMSFFFACIYRVATNTSTSFVCCAILLAVTTTTVKSFSLIPAPVPAVPQLAPETTPSQRSKIQKILGQVFGTAASDVWQERRSQAIDVSQQEGEILALQPKVTVYGELGLEALATVLDAVGVQKGDQFLDIGSGDGVLVAAAALLYPQHLKAARGVEILPTLHQRSLTYQEKLRQSVASTNTDTTSDETTASLSPVPLCCCPTELYEGNVHAPDDQLLEQHVFSETTLAVCFATAWASGVPGRMLPELSRSLGAGGASELPVDARLVVIDGKLCDKDGFRYEGELKLDCPDTAPYSLAHLFTRI
jgi:hypothetical protein